MRLSPRMIVAALTMARLPWGCCQQLMHAQSPRPNHHGSNPLQDGGQCYRQQSTQRGDWQTSVCGVTKAPSNIMNPHDVHTHRSFAAWRLALRRWRRKHSLAQGPCPTSTSDDNLLVTASSEILDLAIPWQCLRVFHNGRTRRIP